MLMFVQDDVSILTSMHLMEHSVDCDLPSASILAVYFESLTSRFCMTLHCGHCLVSPVQNTILFIYCFASVLQASEALRNGVLGLYDCKEHRSPISVVQVCADVVN